MKLTRRAKIQFWLILGRFPSPQHHHPPRAVACVPLLPHRGPCLRQAAWLPRPCLHWGLWLPKAFLLVPCRFRDKHSISMCLCANDIINARNFIPSTVHQTAASQQMFPSPWLAAAIKMRVSQNNNNNNKNQLINNNMVLMTHRKSFGRSTLEPGKLSLSGFQIGLHLRMHAADMGLGCT
jgi:hypothetical protein